MVDDRREQMILIRDASVREFFHETINEALDRQRIDADDHTVFYIVNLLAAFTHAEALYDRTPDGLTLKPLAMIFAEAAEAQNMLEKAKALRRLGDVSLYVAGFFSNSLSRSLVDVDYYISMGGNAYSTLSDVVRGTAKDDLFRAIFDELSAKFEKFVDVLGEVSEASQVNNNQDLLRLYDVWLRTGSKRAEEKLAAQGIHPTDGAKSPFQH